MAETPELPDVEQIRSELQEIATHLQNLFVSLGLPWPPPR